jgi:uncharacterized protein YlxW (UPF0749 family)
MNRVRSEDEGADTAAPENGTDKEAGGSAQRKPDLQQAFEDVLAAQPDVQQTVEDVLAALKSMEEADAADTAAPENGTDKEAMGSAQKKSDALRAVADVFAALGRREEADAADTAGPSRELPQPKESVADLPPGWLRWLLVIGACVALWSMHQDVKKAQSQADAAQGEITDLRKRVDDLATSVDECESKLNDLESSVDDLDSKAGELETTADDLESRVSDLE